MIILATGTNVSVTIKDADLLSGAKTFWAFQANGYYDPRKDFKPVFDKPGAIPRRRLYKKFEEEYYGLLDEAKKAFEHLRTFHVKQMETYASSHAPAAAPAAAAPQQSSGLGSTLEEMLMKSLAEMTAGKVLEQAKPLLEKHIVETFGVLPQVHKVVTPTHTHEIQGVVHEKFDEVLAFINNSIPVFLTGPAGTGKNVICKQVAEAMGLEFYFSNAVTQEYKISGFIDANGKFHETQFYQAFTKGGLFMLDEMDASIPEVLVMLNAAIANRYFDFPTGRVEAHKDFRLIAAGNTYGTGADIQYTGRFQLDDATLNRFVMVEIDYSPAIEKALANGDEALVDFFHALRKSVSDAGLKFLATYRSIDYIKKMEGALDTRALLKTCLFKGMALDDMNIVVDSMRNNCAAENKYFISMKQLVKQS